MLELSVRVTSVVREGARGINAMAGRIWRSLRRDGGQTTAEYALVILAAAAVALVLIAWAQSTGKLPEFFDKVIDNLTQNF